MMRLGYENSFPFMIIIHESLMHVIGGRGRPTQRERRKGMKNDGDLTRQGRQIV